MFVARHRIVHARKGLAPLIFKAGETIQDFESWSFTCRLAALETGQVLDTAAPGPGPNDPPGIAGGLKRLFLQMRDRAAAVEIGGQGLAQQKKRMGGLLKANTSEPIILPPLMTSEPEPVVTIEPVVQATPVGHACDICQVTLPSERGLKIHRSRTHKKA